MQVNKTAGVSVAESIFFSISLEITKDVPTVGCYCSPFVSTDTSTPAYCFFVPFRKFSWGISNTLLSSAVWVSFFSSDSKGAGKDVRKRLCPIIHTLLLLLFLFLFDWPLLSDADESTCAGWKALDNDGYRFCCVRSRWTALTQFCTWDRNAHWCEIDVLYADKNGKSVADGEF